MKVFIRLYNQAFTYTSRFGSIQGGHPEYSQYTCVCIQVQSTHLSVCPAYVGLQQSIPSQNVPAKRGAKL